MPPGQDDGSYKFIIFFYDFEGEIMISVKNFCETVGCSVRELNYFPHRYTSVYFLLLSRKHFRKIFKVN